MALSLAAAGCSSESRDGDARRNREAVSRRPLTALEDRVQAAVAEFRSSRLVPGASVAVITGGEFVNIVAGVADIDTDRPVTTSTQFRVASVTKMYVASVALRLAERGELSLDEPIGRQDLVLPGEIEFASDFTLRQLLSHTTGLGQTPVRDEDRGRPLSPIDLVQRMPPPVCDPGSCWSYGDVNYVLTEIVLEARTGRALADLIRHELIEPFDLNDTSVVNSAASGIPEPPQYALRTDSSGEPAEPRQLFRQAFPLIPTLVTNAADAASFARSLLGGAVLSPSMLAAMLDTAVMRGLPCPTGCPLEYGLGVFRYELAGRRLVGHDGSSGSIVVHDRDDDLTVAILTNGGEQDMGAFLAAVLEAIDG